MSFPIVLTAFGTSSSAADTYRSLLEKLQRLLPDCEFMLAYSSRQLSAQLRKKQPSPDGQDASVGQGLPELLAELTAAGRNELVVQSLHLLPGDEFHTMMLAARKADCRSAIGMPLLTSPDDYEELSELLRPRLQFGPGVVNLVLGHGTNHPSWTGYCALEKVLQKKYGRQIRVGVVEKNPPSDQLLAEIAAEGASRLHILPFFLVAGMHYRRDIIAEKPESWVSRAKAAGLEVSVEAEGVGSLPGLETLVARHISAAREQLNKRESRTRE